jgi:hypothetical protein
MPPKIQSFEDTLSSIGNAPLDYIISLHHLEAFVNSFWENISKFFSSFQRPQIADLKEAVG